MSQPDELPELEGIVASDEFRRYIAELRQTWVPERKYGPSQPERRESDNRTMSTQTPTDCTDCNERMMTRRGAMKAGATAAATAVAIGAGAGNVAAVSGLNFESDVLHDPFIKGTVAVATHRSDFAPLDFVNDNGARESLGTYGAVMAPREDEDTPHNPVTLEASKMDVADYYAFPRGYQFDEDSDGEDDTDVSVLDVTHWSTDESSTAGTLTVEDKTSPADGPGLRISTSGQTTGDTAVATFDSQYVDITSGEDRKLMQFVLDADVVESGVVVTFRVRDEDGDVREAKIDPSGDTANADVIAASTVSGHVYQVPMGELPTTANGDGDFNNLSEFEVEIAEANADISLYAANLEKESEWVYGIEEYLNEDSEVDTQEITEPSGSYTITGLDTLGPTLSGGKLADVQYDVELRTSELPDGAVEYEWADPGAYDQDARFRMVTNLEALTAYDLDWSLTGLYDEVRLPSTRFVETGIATGQAEDVSLADIDDEEVSLTDRTSTYSDASIDTEIELSTAISPGDTQAVFLDILYNSDEKSSATDTAVGAAAATSGSGFFSGARKWIFGIAGVVGSYLGYLRFWK